MENRCFSLSIEVAKICKKLHERGQATIIADRLLCSLVSVGVDIRECEKEKNKTAILKHLSTSLRELKHSFYWLCLLYETADITLEEFDNLSTKFNQITKEIERIK